MRESYLPTVSELTSFVASARLGTTTRAAAELNLTQSAVSRSLATLEERLGVRLFHRVRQRLVLSDAGRALLREAEPLLDSLARAAVATMAFGGRSDVIRLAVLPSFCTAWLIPRLPRFQAAHPGVSFDIAARLAPVDFDADPFDAAIQRRDMAPAAAHATELMAERLIVVAAPALLSGPPAPGEVARAAPDPAGGGGAPAGAPVPRHGGPVACPGRAGVTPGGSVASGDAAPALRGLGGPVAPLQDSAVLPDAVRDGAPLLSGRSQDGPMLPDAALAGLPLLQQSTRPNLWLDWFRDAGLDPRPILRGARFEHFGMLVTAAAAGLGVALVPEAVAEGELAAGRIVRASPRALSVSAPYALIWPDRSATNPALAAFRDWLVAEARVGYRVEN